MKEWAACKKILCVRADNMGDVIMTTPALRALKETFHCHLTLLTSQMGAIITPSIPLIDETIVFDFPWVKTNDPKGTQQLTHLIEQLGEAQFDGVVIFTVFSQNPLPAALIAYMAHIPLRAAYCRENPYHLLTHWIPDKEPYSSIQHQVKRDLELVHMLGAYPSGERLCVEVQASAKESLKEKLSQQGISLHQPFIVFHPGVSEAKREYPAQLWIKLGQLCASELGLRVLVTGSDSECELCEAIATGIGGVAANLAGRLTLKEFIALLDIAPLIVSVNTGTVHIASALKRPLVVFYAMTNPQHIPWATENKVFYFSVDERIKSKNEVLEFVRQKLYKEQIPYPSPGEILPSIVELLDRERLMHSLRISY